MTRPAGAAVAYDGDGVHLDWTCLARRGMLHSDTEAVDHLRLRPGGRLDGRGRDGVAEAWFLLSGRARLPGGRSVGAGDLVLRPPGTVDELVAVEETQLLVLAVMPAEVSAVLPARRPEMPPA
ncbi:hypothetical protein AB0B31_36340 [Catellatospora citrea]|uniref:cupin domain-containing protein n=1 Tax=Catellatospora citrea TaxID=53366 RepID=UPI0033C75869